MGAEGVAKGLKMAFLLGVDALEVEFFLGHRAVPTDDVDTATSTALQPEP